VYSDHRVYQYRSEKVDQDFVVSNGTPCDHFWEVIDALTINPVAVSQITESIERRVRNRMEEVRAASFEESEFAQSLRAGIALPELELVIPALQGQRFTVFDVAAFYALTVPKDLYSDLQVHDMSADFLARIQEEVAALEDPEDALPVLERTLLDQLEKFEKNIPAYRERDGKQFARKLRPVIRPLADLFDEKHVRAAAARVEALGDALSNE
jgi:hypothetical protein